MSRPLCFVLGFALLAAAPARGQDLLEAFVEGFVDGMNGGGNDFDGHDHDHYNHNHNHNYHYPNNQGFHYDPVWHGNHVDYVPHSNGVVYPNGNVVYPSNNVVYPNNNVVYPGTTVVSPATTISSAVVSNALPYKGPGVTIALEEEEGGAVNYMIDGKESATIQAGQQQTLTSKGKYEIRFSRGPNFGDARYTITEGNYHFKVTDKGWELLRDKEQPNIVTAPIQPASPSGIKTNALPPKTAPAAKTVPAANTMPAASTVPAAPAAPAPSAG